MSGGPNSVLKPKTNGQEVEALVGRQRHILAWLVGLALSPLIVMGVMQFTHKPRDQWDHGPIPEIAWLMGVMCSIFFVTTIGAMGLILPRLLTRLPAAKKLEAILEAQSLGPQLGDLSPGSAWHEMAIGTSVAVTNSSEAQRVCLKILEEFEEASLAARQVEEGVCWATFGIKQRLDVVNAFAWPHEFAESGNWPRLGRRVISSTLIRRLERSEGFRYVCASLCTVPDAKEVSVHILLSELAVSRWDSDGWRGVKEIDGDVQPFFKKLSLIAEEAVERGVASVLAESQQRPISGEWQLEDI